MLRRRDPRPHYLWLLITCLLAASLGGVPVSNAAETVSSPVQPASGPGGSATVFDSSIATRHGERPTGYWLFEPAVAGTATTAPQPLIVFLHGFAALDPDFYGAWIDHLVRRGAVVVYPDYQTLSPLGLRPKEYLDNAITAVQAAIAGSNLEGRTPVDQHNMAVVGHSVGGVLSVDLAAVAATRGLPTPKAVMSVEPGGCRGCEQVPDFLGVPISDLSSIDSTSRLQLVVGSSDDAVGTTGAIKIWNDLSHIPLDQRDFVVVQSDDHGDPNLVADHLMPQGSGSGIGVDALDWFGLWKLFDALVSCAFSGTDCETALGGAPSQTSMGQWSDGVPCNPLIVTDLPDQSP